MAARFLARWPGCWRRWRNKRTPKPIFFKELETRFPIRKDMLMKLHSGWLAAGLLLAVVLACNTSKNGNNSNSNNSNNSNSNKSSNTRPANAEVYVETIEMAKDKDGEPGDTTTSYEPGDRTVHCVAHLNKAK